MQLALQHALCRLLCLGMTCVIQRAHQARLGASHALVYQTCLGAAQAPVDKKHQGAAQTPVECKKTRLGAVQYSFDPVQIYCACLL